MIAESTENKTNLQREKMSPIEEKWKKFISLKKADKDCKIEFSLPIYSLDKKVLLESLKRLYFGNNVGKV